MNIANRITILRILIPALFLPALMTNMPYGKVIALFLFALASISDWLDGYLARRYNIASDFEILLSNYGGPRDLFYFDDFEIE